MRRRRLEQDLVDKWELQDAWRVTRSSYEMREGYMRTHVQRGGGGSSIEALTDCMYHCDGWALWHKCKWCYLGHRTIKQSCRCSRQKLHLDLQMPPRARIPTLMVEDRELMETGAQDIWTQMAPFPEQGLEVTHHHHSGIMTLCASCGREANLAALQDI